MLRFSQAVLADNTYSKPFALTYVNTAFFILPLIPMLGLKAYRRPEDILLWKYECAAWIRKRRSSVERKGSAGTISVQSPLSTGRRRSVSESQQLLLGDPMIPPQHMSSKSHYDVTRTSDQLSLPETMKLGFEFCMLWFLANYFIGVSLEYTTVASSTILTSTASIFTLIFGVVFKVEKFTLRKLLGVLASLAGIILVSSVDLSGDSSDDDHRGSFPQKSFREVAVGDILALLAAVMYGIYAVFMKKRIPDESAVNMPLFFGLVGLINVLLLWPGFFILHWTGIERFSLPPDNRTTLIIVSNAIASMVADLAWAYAVLLTSPIVVTVGLSTTIPLSLIGQIVFNSQSASVLYWVGALVVVLSFVFVNHEDKSEDTRNIEHTA